ncbi:glycine zipper domain-containing protein [Noviherbaspirillum sp. CPCC 100848]|uniref:Glycine zipper domain-containing protein n=1 Tax=Noviherbaspirillum album TaxID=3080276 RepID=A0ABU6JAL2_9BURK|nr:glycine zipper domain-containing protein [Noviherbaspirillum sp. CPCC 100848]MEC4720683.1 glycine zipper domain-containing protein [Noviherbaspirillum sp. CPCC 100848]
MTTIIAGRFQEQSEATYAVEELLRAGFDREQLCYFFCNPAGQHGAYPIGGDENISPGAKQSGKGVAAGAATGAVVGAAATPVLGPVGAVTGSLVGAHIGGLVGSMSSMKDQDEMHEEGSAPRNPVPVRQSGMMVAVAVPQDDEYHDRAVNVLRSLGAMDIEQAQGTMENGDWVDFDPVSLPQLIDYAPEQSRPSGPNQRA